MKEGVAFLAFASLALLRDLAEEAFEASLGLLNLPRGFLGLLKRGYYSLTYLGRLCLMVADKLKGARGLGRSWELANT